MQLGHRAALHHVDAVTHIVAGNGQPLPVEEQQFLEELLQLQIFFFTAAEDDLVAPGHNSSIEAGIDEAQKFVVPPQDGNHLLLIIDFNYMFVR